MAKFNLSNIRQSYIENFINKLAIEGKRLIENANRTKETRDRSGNQHDAYVYGVFYKGKLEKYGFLDSMKSKGVHEGWAKHNIPDDNGRGYAMQAIRSYKPKTDGFVLVAMNAIYYTQILEDGKQYMGTGKRYKIASQILSEMSVLQGKYKGSNVDGIRLDK